VLAQILERATMGEMTYMSDPPPASAEGLTAAELAAALADMERVLAQEPMLNDFGFGAFGWRSLTPEERAAAMAKDRERIREPGSLAQFLAARRWLAGFAKLKSLNQRGSSYGLKHHAAHDIGYVTNGVFIAAAIAEGFRVQRIRFDGPNAWFNIASAAWRRV
jgi:hypothetical protein